MTEITSTRATKLRVLCFHGYLQNAEIMMKSMNRLFSNQAGRNLLEFVCIEGDLDCGFRTTAAGTGASEPAKGWWKLEKELINTPHEYREIEAVLQRVGRELGTDGIDVVVGFSQGAVLATVLLGRGLLPGCKLAILMSGADVQDAAVQPDIGSIDIPAVLLYGNKDTLCTREDAENLGKRYRSTTFVGHRHGHVIPSDSKTRDVLLGHLREVQSAQAGPVQLFSILELLEMKEERELEETTLTDADHEEFVPPFPDD